MSVLTPPHPVVFLVSQGMVNRKGSAATMMSALAGANINIKAIAQVRIEPLGQTNLTTFQRAAQRGKQSV